MTDVTHLTVITSGGASLMPPDTVFGNPTGQWGYPQPITMVQLTAMLDVFTPDLQGVVPASGHDPDAVLFADATWREMTIGNLAPIPPDTVVGNVQAHLAPPQALTQTELTGLINVFTQTLSGAVPAPGTTTPPTNVLSAAGTWVQAASSIVSPAANGLAPQIVNPGVPGGVSSPFIFLAGDVTWRPIGTSQTGGVNANITINPTDNFIAPVGNSTITLPSLTAVPFGWRILVYWYGFGTGGALTVALNPDGQGVLRNATSEPSDIIPFPLVLPANITTVLEFIAQTSQWTVINYGAPTTQMPGSLPAVGALTNAADDTAAAAAGVIVGGYYRNGSQLMVRVA